MLSIRARHSLLCCALCACAAGHHEHTPSAKAEVMMSNAEAPPATRDSVREVDSGPGATGSPARPPSPAAGSGTAGMAATAMAADGGAAGAAGSSPGADAADDAGTPGAPAAAPNTEWLGGGKPVPCATDADCRKSLFTPVCGATTRLCEVCPDPEQERALALRVNACILTASPRCLDDEDCRFAGCITTCDGSL